MRILLTGKTGQIGYELERSLQGLGEIVAVDRRQMDLANLKQVREVIRTVKPALIVNAAAYTAVDQAESEPDLAMRINGFAPEVMAEEAKRLGAAMIQYSTDYVFDGTKSSAYTESDVPCPVNCYGRSKLVGEQAVASAGISYFILRTSWVYSVQGKNFLTTILRRAEEENELQVVDDQVGAPTWSRTVAEATARAIMLSLAHPQSRNAQQDWWKRRSGIYHLTCQGKTTWYRFAQSILNAMPQRDEISLIPVSSEDYPSKAMRPKNSEMNCNVWARTFCELPTWEEALRSCLC